MSIEQRPVPGRESPFHDHARVLVQAGRGGDGALSFRREKYVPRGGPDGGDGGRGGDVVLIADADLRDLSVLGGRQHLRAQRGGSGGGRGKHGADGDSIELRVPVGTQVLDEDGQVVADLARAAARAVIARGGRGGRGNRRFATPVRRTPRFAEVGEPGDQSTIELRLKLVVDAALAGLPNAGKSSLLRAISNAKPKVADYPFTTLVPVMGTVDGPDGAQLTVVDVPGLIEGASEGLGLGHEFLAHLERARLLLHVIDAADGDSLERFRLVDRELAAHGAGLEKRPQLIVLNKVDLLDDPPSLGADDARIVGAVAVSAATGEGIGELRRRLFELCPPEQASADADVADELVDFLVYRPKPTRRAYRILRTDRGFRVSGRPVDDDELEQVLREAGARSGDEIEIDGTSWWMP